MRKSFALLSVLILAAAACSSAGATPSPSAAAPTAPPSVAPPAAAGAATIMVADSALGQILVDGEGRTLYLFTPDEATGEPTCYDKCAENWPALLAEGDVSVGEGIDEAKVTTVARTDGGEQVKIGEYPLYYFASDKAAGDTNGQGVGEKWYVVSPDGEEIK